MFRHFDRGNKEYITRQDFVAAFSTDIKEQTFQIQIEDIIKPLTTKLNKFKVNIGAMFDKVDKDRNYRISAEEFATSISESSGGKIKLDAAEIKMMRDYFQNRY
jgi:Ca2+-binding EF-hand superfamily protein